MYTVYSVFYISILEPAIPNTSSSQSKPLPPPVVIDNELKYEFFWIVDSNRL